MSLPSYNKENRRRNYNFELLPKGAYVVRIISAKEEKKKSGNGTYLKIAFDIAEGEHENFYSKQYEANTNEDKKWSFDAVYYLNVPDDNSEDYIWTNWNTFFADLEDSNGGFVFKGDVKTLKGKLIGGKFCNEQSEKDGKIYDHTRLKWTCIADDVRSGNLGSMPKDKLIDKPTKEESKPDANGFMNIPDDSDEEVPF